MSLGINTDYILSTCQPRKNAVRNTTNYEAFQALFLSRRMDTP